MQQCPLKTDTCQHEATGLTIDDLSSAAARGNLQLVQKLLKKGNKRK